MNWPDQPPTPQGTDVRSAGKTEWLLAGTGVLFVPTGALLCFAAFSRADALLWLAGVATLSAGAVQFGVVKLISLVFDCRDRLQD